MKFLSACNKEELKGKAVLVRVDINIDRDARSFLRIDAVIPTIKFLYNAHARVVLLAHEGRPESCYEFQKQECVSICRIDQVLQSMSMAHNAPLLEDRLRLPLTFIPGFDMEDIKRRLHHAPNGSIFLLENLRFIKGEKENDKNVARMLSGLGDVYVNDAFSVSHRAHASVHAITKYLPSYAGLSLESEIKNLERFVNEERPKTVIMGGAKVVGKIDAIESLMTNADHLLTGGVLATTLLVAEGKDVKKSLYEKEKVALAATLLVSPKTYVPEDWIEENDAILDIGPLTEKRYQEIIMQSKSIIWNGPLGYTEKAEFRKGSEFIARAIVESGARACVGGGQTVALLENMGIVKQFEFISTGGGAMLEFLGGKKLPGIEALNSSHSL